MKKSRSQMRRSVPSASKSSHVIGLRTGMLVELVTLRFAQKRAGQTIPMTERAWLAAFLRLCKNVGK